MKAIVSFSSFPFFHKHNFKRGGHFYDLESFFNSFVISSCLAHKHFGNLELYTDTYGKLMLEKLRLPFNHIHTVLDNLTDKEHCMWSVAKLKTHTYQNTPYAMIDYDVFLWDPLPKFMLGAEIFCQNIETHTQFYHHALNSYIHNCNNKHFIIDEYVKKNGFNVFAPNCGIVGGNNFNRLKEYANIVLHMINNASNPWDEYLKIPMFLEQWFLGMFCNHHKIKIKSFGIGYDWWEKQYKYTHLQSDVKKSKFMADKLKARVQKDFSHYIPHIQQAIKCLDYEGSGGFLLYENYL